jgi:hypothetical protein
MIKADLEIGKSGGIKGINDGFWSVQEAATPCFIPSEYNGAVPLSVAK